MESNIKRRLWGTLVTASNISGLSYVFMFHKSFLSYLTGWYHWGSAAVDLLEQAEEKLLSYIKKPIQLQFFKIPPFGQVKEECSIRTLTINKEKGSNNSFPLVLLHGFASGIGFWILNLESLSKNRTIYAIDLLGFGRSSRPPFSKEAELAEDQFVESIEQWRKQVQLDNFILLGHSMGGYLAASYAMKYPDRVKHLILADPWGFSDPDMSVKKIEIPVWFKVIACMLRPFNPLAGLRAAGQSYGPNLVKRLRPDLLGKFQHVVEDPSDLSNYIYYCNAQTPSGEAAFKAMSATEMVGWAKRPMLKRITQLRSDISITFIYGSHSWIDSISGVQCATLRSNVEVKVIQGAGHHVYADRALEFNRLVNNSCDEVDATAYLFDPNEKETCKMRTGDNEVNDLSSLPVV